MSLTYFKFLKRQVCSGFIITHIVIPGLRELQELSFLGSFNVLQFLLLGSSDVVTLALRLLLE